MALAMCPKCSTDDQLFLVALLDDGRRRIGCRNCGAEWEHGQAVQKAKPSGSSAFQLRGRFPKAEDVEPAAAERAASLKQEFLSTVPYERDPQVASYWANYQRIFSVDGLPNSRGEDLKNFASDPTGLNLGNMAEFNKAWERLGPDAGAMRVRRVIHYLLRGPGASLEDRLTGLIQGKVASAMPGFKEALITKTLCVVHPDRFLTVVTYHQKRTIAKAVYGLELPEAGSGSLTIGRLVVWGNDVLRELIGGGFVDQQHEAQFLAWAKDQAPAPV